MPYAFGTQVKIITLYEKNAFRLIVHKPYIWKSYRLIFYYWKECFHAGIMINIFHFIRFKISPGTKLSYENGVKFLLVICHIFPPAWQQKPNLLAHSFYKNCFYLNYIIAVLPLFYKQIIALCFWNASQNNNSFIP